MNLTKIVKVFTSKFVGTGPSSYKKRIYQAAVSQKLRNTASKLATCQSKNWNQYLHLFIPWNVRRGFCKFWLKVFDIIPCSDSNCFQYSINLLWIFTVAFNQ